MLMIFIGGEWIDKAREKYFQSGIRKYIYTSYNTVVFKIFVQCYKTEWCSLKKYCILKICNKRSFKMWRGSMPTLKVRSMKQLMVVNIPIIILKGSNWISGNRSLSDECLCTAKFYIYYSMLLTKFIRLSYCLILQCFRHTTYDSQQLSSACALSFYKRLLLENRNQ